MTEKMSATELHANLGHFTGSMEWTAGGPLLPNVIYSEGALYLAENAGAFWLLEAIGIHLVTAGRVRNERKKNAAFNAFHIWTLKKVGESGAVLECTFDTGHKPVATQEIEYTDFPFPPDNEFKLYVGTDGPNSHIKIFLPSEY